MPTTVERIVINEIDQSQGRVVLDDQYNVLIISESFTDKNDTKLYTDAEEFTSVYGTTLANDKVALISAQDFINLGLGVYVSNEDNCQQFKDKYRFDVLFIYDTRKGESLEVDTITSLLSARLDCIYLPADFSKTKDECATYDEKTGVYTDGNFSYMLGKCSTVKSGSCSAYYAPAVTVSNVEFPGSYAFLRNFANSIGAGTPCWYAIAGINRGLLSYVSGTSREIDDEEALECQDKAKSNYNPIVNLSSTYGNVIWGQRTMQAENTSLKSMNVRIMSCMIKKRIFNISLNLLFEMNDLALWNEFRGLLTPYLNQIKFGRGLHDFDIIMDQKTQESVDEMTVKGVVRIQPTRSAEYFDIDFVLTSQGAEVEE